MEHTTEQRAAILQREIARYLGRGFRVVSQTDTTAQLWKSGAMSRISCLIWFLVNLFTLGMALFVFVPYWFLRKDESVYLEVDSNGRVLRR